MKRFFIKLGKFALNQMLQWYEKNDGENKCVVIIKQVLIKLEYVLKDWATPTEIPIPIVEKKKKEE